VCSDSECLKTNNECGVDWESGNEWGAVVEMLFLCKKKREKGFETHQIFWTWRCWKMRQKLETSALVPATFFQNIQVQAFHFSFSFFTIVFFTESANTLCCFELSFEFKRHWITSKRNISFVVYVFFSSVWNFDTFLCVQ
jgi:hypothetical protein